MTGLQKRISGWKTTIMVQILMTELKTELAGLLEEDAKKADKLRRLALYSCRLLGGYSNWNVRQ